MKVALDTGALYQADFKKKTPLEYAILRKSYDCSAKELDYIMSKSTKIYSRMKQDEIIDLIKFSPSNLKEFFDGAMVEEELGLPTYGVLLKEPMTFCLEDGIGLSKAGIKKLLVFKDDNFDGIIDEDSPDALPLVFKTVQFEYNW